MIDSTESGRPHVVTSATSLGGSSDAMSVGATYHHQQQQGVGGGSQGSAEPTTATSNQFSSPAYLSRNNSGLEAFYAGAGGGGGGIPLLREGMPGSFRQNTQTGIGNQHSSHHAQPQSHQQHHHFHHHYHGGSNNNLAAASPVHQQYLAATNTTSSSAATGGGGGGGFLRATQASSSNVSFQFAKQDQNACSHCFGADTIVALASEADAYIDETLPQITSLDNNDSFFPVPCPPPTLSPMSGAGGSDGRQHRTGSDLRQSFRNSNRLSSSGNQFAMQSSMNNSSVVIGEGPGGVLLSAHGGDNNQSGVAVPPTSSAALSAAHNNSNNNNNGHLFSSRTSRDEVLSPRSIGTSSGLEPKILSLQEIQLHHGFSPKLGSADTVLTPPLSSTGVVGITPSSTAGNMASSTTALTPQRRSSTALLHRQWSSASQLSPSSPSNQRHSFTGGEGQQYNSFNSSNTNNTSNPAMLPHHGGSGEQTAGTPVHRHSDGGSGNGGVPPPMTLPSPTTRVIHLPSPLLSGSRSLGQHPISPVLNSNNLSTTVGPAPAGGSANLSFSKAQRKDSDILKGQLGSLSHGQLLLYAERLTTWMHSINIVAINRLVDPCTCGTVAIAESTPDLGGDRADESPRGETSLGRGDDGQRTGGISRFASFFNVSATTSDPHSQSRAGSGEIHQPAGGGGAVYSPMEQLPPSHALVVSNPTPNDNSLAQFQAFVVAGGGGQYFGQPAHYHGGSGQPQHQQQSGGVGTHSFASAGASLAGGAVSTSLSTIGTSGAALSAPHHGYRKSSIDTVASAGTGVSSATNSPTLNFVPGLPTAAAGGNGHPSGLPQLPPSLPNSSRSGHHSVGGRRGTVTILPQRAGGRQKSVVVFASTNSSAHARPRQNSQGLEHPRGRNLFNVNSSPIPEQASPRHAPLLTFEPMDPSTGMDADEPSTHHEPLRARKSLIMSTHVAIDEDDGGFEMVNQYLMMEEIGSGCSGVVFAVCNTDNNSDYAMKMIKRDRFSQPRRGSLSGGGHGGGTTNREVAIMKKLRHPHVVRLHEVIDDPSHNKLYLVMQLLTGGRLCPSLDAATGACEPVAAGLLRRYVYQMCDGLRYLHQHNIIHRDDFGLLYYDLPLPNVVLVDFGVSEQTADDIVEGAVGTPAFMAPEVWAGDKVSGAAADVWSLGVSVFMMLVGRSPFPATNRTDLIEQVKNRNPDFPHDVDAEWRKLLKGMLTKDPATRSSLSAVMRNVMFADFRAHDANGNSVRPSALRGAIVVTEDDLQTAIADRADFQVLVCDDETSPAESTSVLEQQQRPHSDTPKAAVATPKHGVQPLREGVTGSSDENLSQRSSPGALASTQFYGSNPVLPLPIISTTSVPNAAGAATGPLGAPMSGTSGSSSARAFMHGIVTYGNGTTSVQQLPSPAFSGNVSAMTASISPNHLAQQQQHTGMMMLGGGGSGLGENSVATSYGFGEHSLSAPYGALPPTISTATHSAVAGGATMVVCIPEEKLQRAKSRARLSAQK
ncbi:calcium calmodulin-dependent protein kinase kinase beta isoform 2, putative [Bodo saltans]|uniref:Calcium calmodulin-dependent protein kinase kinase beta isoform 2, putative n=1 Tax=Bodo saltans TaxID=75058 RepID=A0A0S4IZE5_BODSA|nr:calcium calmodulin-dependent protein kinase kinase beta isoform 2, putative [Bodo saltans]|eukprot:CUG29234.1 calcium calmodulin-dependent protein kinase kinase beta isoform 2, putative [Bodo saltans]